MSNSINGDMNCNMASISDTKSRLLSDITELYGLLQLINKPTLLTDTTSNLIVLIYSYFEKGCRKKCTRQSRKVLRVVLSSLFFKGILTNDTRGHEHMFATAKGKQQK